jgi:polyisoprenoid-binding protein YceI
MKSTRAALLLAPFILFLFAASASAQAVVTAAQVNGTWKLKNRSTDNEFKILALGQGKLKVAFDGSYLYRDADGERSANSGSASGTAHIEGTTAIFKPDDTDDCKITMKFLRGKLIVSEEGSCGFGFNVSSDGTYTRTSALKPKFE